MVSQALCRCGHVRGHHIYDEGACRPGFACPMGCQAFVAAAPSATHERPEMPTMRMVDLLLEQVERDRSAPYWSEPPHSESLDHAESWLLSLRDWLAEQ